MNKEKNYYINIPFSLDAENWVNTKKAEKEIKNIGGNEIVLPFFDPLKQKMGILSLVFHIELKESQFKKYENKLRNDLRADISESAEEYHGKYPQNKKLNA